MRCASALTSAFAVAGRSRSSSANTVRSQTLPLLEATKGRAALARWVVEDPERVAVPAQRPGYARVFARWGPSPRLDCGPQAVNAADRQLPREHGQLQPNVRAFRRIGGGMSTTGPMPWDRMPGSAGAPPGWYLDRATRRNRWWDGARWADDSTPAVYPPAALGRMSFRTHLQRAAGALFVVSVLAVGLSACAEERVAVQGTVQVTCSSWEKLESLLPTGATMADKVKVYEKTPVSISDASGKVVASTTLGPEREVELESGAKLKTLCEHSWSAKVPKAEFYTVNISSLQWVGIPRDRLQVEPVKLYGFYSTSTGPTFRFESDHQK
jgi:hypothetical protein